MPVMIFYGCSENHLDETYTGYVDSPDMETATGDLYFEIGFNESDVQTKLTHEEIDDNGRKGIISKWEEDDIISLNGHPSTTDYQYSLVLDSGAGTVYGTFKLSGSYAIQSYVWALYYPGDRVKFEEDFLKFSYLNQTQSGNGNINHLKEFHSIRYIESSDQSYININDMTDIDFTGSNIQQSGCLKFNLSGLEAMVPTEITLEYFDASGNVVECFYTYNTLSSYYGSYPPVNERKASITLTLEDFTETTDITAYIMMSNGDVEVKQDGKFRVTVTNTEGNKYYCEKTIKADATLSGGELNTITCTSWTKMSPKDGMVDPKNAVVVLQEKTIGNGTDIIIMGDGYIEDNIGEGSIYETVMKQAYSDFFTVEPFASLKEYFNVYYINAVSNEAHDAVPHSSGNGAVQGDSDTIFNTQFTAGSTHISGNDAATVSYAMQAIRSKGGPRGTPCTDEDEVYARAHKALIIVMINVDCHAGTCYLRSTYTEDYGNSYSVAYTAVNESDNMRKWTMIHEAGGHGFGKLLDEYSTNKYVSFDSGIWDQFKQSRNIGIGRNIDIYWGSGYPGSAKMNWNGTIKQNTVEVTSDSNVYWKELISSYSSENIGVYEGANTVTNFYCRSTPNSIMNAQFAENGQFFNAISRWAIWYRLMRLTGVDVGTDFDSSLSKFLEFDSTLTIIQNTGEFASTKSINEVEPTSPPTIILGRWENGHFIEE